MALISAMITEIRTDLNDDDSTRWTDAKILNVIKKAIRRANRIVQRNGVHFAKKVAAITTVANQAYLTLSTSVTDFDVFISLWHDDNHREIALKNEHEWEGISSASALDYCHIDYTNDKLEFQSTPSSAEALTLWYYPTVDPSAYTVSSSMPWSGRLDDMISEYVIARLKNIDEMSLDFEQQTLADMENQILQAYAPNSPCMVEGNGWL